MSKRTYDVQCLPPTEQDFYDIVRYITIKLENPKAAEDFSNLYDKKVNKLSDGINLGQPLRGNLPKRIRDYDYRWIVAKNYLVFITIYETKPMIFIHHVTYGKRDLA